jgi:predicted nucleic acid-binding protein
VSAVVVDASVAVAWFVEEDGSALARQLATSGHGLIAPDFLLLELASSFARRAAAGSVPRGFAAETIRVLRRRQEVVLRATEPLLAQAATLAEELPHPLHDCLYLALAQREGAWLATFDRRLTRYAQRLSIPLWAAEDTA